MPIFTWVCICHICIYINSYSVKVFRCLLTGFRMDPGLEERRIAAVVGALVADAAGMYFFQILYRAERVTRNPVGCMVAKTRTALTLLREHLQLQEDQLPRIFRASLET